MTDKQIIIDGVDVSKCKHHRKCILPDNIGCKIDDFLCCDKPNCYFKQLALKTQECESLNKRASSLEEIADNLQQRNHHLTQECEELIKEKAEIKKYLGISDKTIMQRLEELTEYKLKRQLEYIKIQEENDRYRKALEEIEKEIRDFQCDNCEDYHCETCDMKDILVIINKAKE